MRFAFPIVLTSALVALAAPVKDAPKGNLYFATEVGAKWVYKNDGQSETQVVTSVEVKDGAKFVTLAEELQNGKLVPDGLIEVSSRGVFRHAGGRGLKIGKEPLCLLNLSLKPGKRWEFDIKAGNQIRAESGLMVASEPEEIEVPAGKFRAIRVDSQLLTINGEELKNPWPGSYWYAQGVGLVKMIYGPKGEFEKVLVSFKSGKK